LSLPQEQKIELMIDRMITMNESLGTGRDMTSFLERVVNIAMDFTMAMRGAFLVPNGHGEQIIIASRNLDTQLLKADQLSLIQGVVSLAAKQNREIIFPGAIYRENIAEKELVHAGIDSLICIPCRLGNETMAIFTWIIGWGKSRLSPSIYPVYACFAVKLPWAYPTSRSTTR
jgi:hypothetical protein